MAIVRVALPVAAHQIFDYWLPAGLDAHPGGLVQVKLGSRRLTGVVVAIAAHSELAPDRLLPIESLVASIPPLPPDLMELAGFVASYYQEPIGLSLAQMLPPLGAVRQPRAMPRHRYRLTIAGGAALASRAQATAPRLVALRDMLAGLEGAAIAAIRELGPHAVRTLNAWRQAAWVEELAESIAASTAVLQLNADQHAAIAAAVPEPSAFQCALLQGVTGSGKTEVYLAAAAGVIARGEQALLLVPEINLTPQLEHRIANALPGVSVAVLHSRLASGERRRSWLACANGEAQLIVGTRLGVFAPAPRLGLIVVDEEHDASYKQQDGVRYHARDVAIYRARQRAIPILLGSATPSLESYAQARRGRYRWLKLPLRASASALLPSVRLVANRTAESGEGIGPVLRDAIAARLQRREQSLLFINRRGYAPSLLCVACGWKAQCPRCAVRLVVHRDAGQLRCHHCGHIESLPRACPDCGNQDLLPLGFGTQRLERALRDSYPEARILRVDRDSTQRKGSFAGMREAIAAGDVDILVGTQMLAKGHDFPRLTLVGVLGADNALYSAEFRATERLFALLEQVAGRAGRRALPGEVIVQTDFPQHPLYEALVSHDFDRFAETLLAERESVGLPPYGHLALLVAEAKSRELLTPFLDAAAASGKALAAGQARPCQVYAPVSANMARRAGLERGQVLAQSDDRRSLQELLPRWRAALEQIGERRIRWSLDVDPLSFA